MNSIFIFDNGLYVNLKIYIIIENDNKIIILFDYFVSDTKPLFFSVGFAHFF